LKNELLTDPGTDRIGKQTRKCLFSGARREFTSRRGELKNATTAFFNKLPGRISAGNGSANRVRLPPGRLSDVSPFFDPYQITTGPE
jgi:hypothetical protein